MALYVGHESVVNECLALRVRELRDVDMYICAVLHRWDRVSDSVCGVKNIGRLSSIPQVSNLKKSEALIESPISLSVPSRSVKFKLPLWNRVALFKHEDLQRSIRSAS